MNGSPENRLFDELGAKLASSFELLTRASAASVWEPSAAPSTAAVYWTRTPVVLAAAPEHWQAAGKRVLAAGGIENAGDIQIKAAFLELLDQVLPGGRETHAPEEDLVWASCRVSFENDSVALSIGVAGASAKPSPAAAPADSKTFELLLDVEMPVSISFGRAQLPLKEVLKLATGSIVELNRAATDLVDVVVNNCVIARGEVVMVEGNFGVRIQQVISRHDRLRSLE